MRSYQNHCLAPVTIYLYIAMIQYSTAFSVYRHHPHISRRHATETRISTSYDTRSPSALGYSINSDVESLMDQSIIEQHRSVTLPFQSSIAGPNADLTFDSFWEWHMSFLEKNLSGLRSVDCTSRDSVAYGDTSTSRYFNNFAYSENVLKQARIHNRCFASDDFRKIRMTYYDGGERCQVFNALWYPRHGSNLPVLGVDLLAFGSSKPNTKKRYLAIVDFQPVDAILEGHPRPQYEQDIMAPIRKKYPSLHGKMTERFYDETQFFSHEMLFGRFDDDDTDAVAQTFPAFTEYVKAYAELVEKEQQQHQDYDYLTLKLLEEAAKERQVAYDNYSADRDPAKKMFEGVFGKEWAEEFVHGFLFSLSSPEANVLI